MNFIYSNKNEEDTDFYFEDEESNLNVKIDTDILAIADLGLWNGRKHGYKVIGNNLSSILRVWDSCDTIEIGVDKGNVVGTGYHHDGTNYITFRKFKEGITEKARDKVIEAIYNNSDNEESLIKRNTRSLAPEVNAIYGWRNCRG